MSSGTLFSDPASSPPVEATQDDALAYRAIHTGAIIALLLGIVSWMFPMMVATTANLINVAPLIGLPLIAIGLSAWSLSTVRANREYYTGEKAALGGLISGTLALLLSVSWGSYVYATEVPDGYTRTSFLEMKPTDDDIAAQDPVPPEIDQLMKAGTPVFIKGYIRPDSAPGRNNINKFLLVRDSNACCFGDLSKVQFFDQIAIQLGPGLTTNLTPKVYRVGGKLSLRRGNPATGEPLLVYSLDADYITPRN